MKRLVAGTLLLACWTLALDGGAAAERAKLSQSITYGKTRFPYMAKRFPRDLTYSPDGKWLAAACQIGSADVRVFDAATKKQVAELKTKSAITGDVSVSFGPRGVLLASCYYMLNIWADGLDKPSRRFPTRVAEYYDVAVTPDGKHMVTVAMVNRKRHETSVWSIPDGKKRMLADDGFKWLRSVVVTPDGKRAITIGEAIGADGKRRSEVRCFNLADGKQVYRTPAELTDYVDLAISPSGRSLAAGCYDNIRCFDAATGKLTGVLKGHEDFVRGVAFSPDSTLLASCGEDKTVRLWDFEKQRSIQTLKQHKQVVTSVAFSPDGAELVSGGGGGELNFWKIDPPARK